MLEIKLSINQSFKKWSSLDSVPKYHRTGSIIAAVHLSWCALNAHWLDNWRKRLVFITTLFQPCSRSTLFAAPYAQSFSFCWYLRHSWMKKHEVSLWKHVYFRHEFAPELEQGHCRKMNINPVLQCLQPSKVLSPPTWHPSFFCKSSFLPGKSENLANL